MDTRTALNVPLEDGSGNTALMLSALHQKRLATSMFWEGLIAHFVKPLARGLFCAIGSKAACKPRTHNARLKTPQCLLPQRPTNCKIFGHEWIRS